MNPDLGAVARILRDGGVAVLPTDTIYGYHCLAGDPAAIKQIASLKERDEAKPFIVLGNSIEQLEALGARFLPAVRNALLEVWPAPLTAVVRLRKAVAASRGAETIGVRVPDLVWLRELLTLTGPLASTSLNRSGDQPMKSPEELPQAVLDRVGIVVDTGPLSGKASTLVDLTEDEPRFIRGDENLFTQNVWKTLRKSL